MSKTRRWPRSCFIRELIPDVPEPDDISDGLSYVMAADAARFLCDQFVDGKTDYFPALFSRVENLVINGPPRARNLAIVGLLEDLQNATLRAEMSLDVWREWLWPTSAVAWSAVERFWNGDVGVLRDFQRKTGLDLGEPNT